MPHPDAIIYSDHGDDEREQAGFTQAEVREALSEGTVIERYADTGRGSSYLMLHWTAGNLPRPIHVVVTDKEPDAGSLFSIIVTVYDPSTEPEEWT